MNCEQTNCPIISNKDLLLISTSGGTWETADEYIYQLFKRELYYFKQEVLKYENRNVENSLKRLSIHNIDNENENSSDLAPMLCVDNKEDDDNGLPYVSTASSHPTKWGSCVIVLKKVEKNGKIMDNFSYKDADGTRQLLYYPSNPLVSIDPESITTPGICIVSMNP